MKKLTLLGALIFALAVSASCVAPQSADAPPTAPRQALAPAKAEAPSVAAGYAEPLDVRDDEVQWGTLNEAEDTTDALDESEEAGVEAAQGEGYSTGANYESEPATISEKEDEAPIQPRRADAVAPPALITSLGADTNPSAETVTAVPPLVVTAPPTPIINTTSPPSSEPYRPPVAENGSYYGEISPATGRPKTVQVDGYYRRDGTYVRGHYRSAPRRRN